LDASNWGGWVFATVSEVEFPSPNMSDDGVMKLVRWRKNLSSEVFVVTTSTVELSGTASLVCVQVGPGV
jgi:hypothetical protein